MKKGEVQLLDEQKRRHDGRAPNETRPISMKVGVLDRADGSALVEFGKTKVLAAVYGPREVYPKHLAVPDKAIFRVAAEYPVKILLPMIARVCEVHQINAAIEETEKSQKQSKAYQQLVRWRLLSGQSAAQERQDDDNAREAGHHDKQCRCQR